MAARLHTLLLACASALVACQNYIPTHDGGDDDHVRVAPSDNASSRADSDSHESKVITHVEKGRYDKRAVFLYTPELRRLTKTQYQRTTAQILGIDTAEVASKFQVEDDAIGFTAASSVNTAIVQDYTDAAELLATRAVAANVARFTACTPTAKDDACVLKMILDFGQRFYRRPLEAGEADRFLQSLQTAYPDADMQRKIEVALTRFLQSPQFLYVVEKGRGAADSTGMIPLNPFEGPVRRSHRTERTARGKRRGA